MDLCLTVHNCKLHTRLRRVNSFITTVALACEFDYHALSMKSEMNIASTTMLPESVYSIF